MAGATGLRFTFPRHDIPHNDSPLFERMGTDEYAQLLNARQTTDTLQQRIHDLEKVNLDLEYRLEEQAKQCMEIEKECVSIERSWEAKCKDFEDEISFRKQQFEAQKMKSDRVRDHLSRTERELYGILQRKYELIRGPGVRTTGSSSFSVPEKRPSWDAGKMLMRSNTPTGPYGSTEELAAHQLVSDFSSCLWLIVQCSCEMERRSLLNSYPLIFFLQNRAPQESRHRCMLGNLTDFLGL